MKKLINEPLNVVREMLEGAVCFAPDLALLTDENVVVQRDLPVQPSVPQRFFPAEGVATNPPMRAMSVQAC
jgi:hypothetical protein